MLNRVKTIVKEASKIMLDRHFECSTKGEKSNLVTSSDIAVEKYLRERLMPLCKDCGFIGEESDNSDYNHEYLWVVDPIDGTSNFVRGLSASTISVGLVKDGRAVLGVVYNPYLDEMYSAEENHGAFLNDMPIHVSDRDFAHGIFCTAMSLYRKEFGGLCNDILLKVYDECDDFRRLGSAALELSALAAGRVELYFEMRVFPWDFAASDIIIREAGGYVGTLEYDSTVFTRPIPLIAANTKESYEKLYGIVTSVVDKIPY